MSNILIQIILGKKTSKNKIKPSKDNICYENALYLNYIENQIKKLM